MAFLDENEDTDFPTEGGFDEYDDQFEDDMPEEASNRTFIIAASVLGGIILLALLCVAGYALLVLPNQRNAAASAESTKVAQNTQVAEMLTATTEAEALALTPLNSPTVVFSPTPSPTPAVVAATETPTATPNIAATGTVAAALTQASESILTIVPTTSALPDAELPDGGFADDVGIPGLAAAVIILIGIIFLARRLRSAATN